MAHIALIVTGLTGRLYSSFEMATRLKNEGHSITYLCPKDVREKVENLDFQYIQLPPINMGLKNGHPELDQYSSWFKKFKYHLKNYSKHYETVKQALSLDTYQNILKKLNPDHVVIDMELHDLIFTATSLKLPITLFTAWFSNRMGLGLTLPPLRTDIIPKKGLRGSSIGILVNWILIKVKVQVRIIINKLTFKDYRRKVLKKYAKRNGFPVNTLISSNLPFLFCYTNLPILSLTLSEMDFPHKAAKNHIYVGPMVYEKRDSKFDAQTKIILDSIIEEKLKTGKKIIYFSAGSILVPEIDFINKVMEAVKEKKEWLLVISLGGKLNSSEFKKQNNCFFLSWVPQLKILEHTNCCITHAGINTINECLHYSVPMLVYSGKIADENGNASRIHYHKIGIMRDKAKDNHHDIKNNLEKILSDSSFKNNINTFNIIYKMYQKNKVSDFLNI